MKIRVTFDENVKSIEITKLAMHQGLHVRKFKTCPRGSGFWGEDYFSGVIQFLSTKSTNSCSKTKRNQQA